MVPFAEKDEAKALGVRWDGVARVWYIPADKDSAPFDRWLPKVVEPDVRAQNYYISQSSTPCWKCEGITRVYGFILSGFYEVSEWIEGGDDDDEGTIVWDEWTDTTVLSYVRGLPDAVLQRVKLVSPHWYMDSSRTVSEPYLMNHCEHCKAKLGDFETIQEADSALHPIYPESISRMSIMEVDESFLASASYGIGTGPDLIAMAQRIVST